MSEIRQDLANITMDAIYFTLYFNFLCLISVYVGVTILEHSLSVYIFLIWALYTYHLALVASRTMQ